jgi:hypothetical protein
VHRLEVAAHRRLLAQPAARTGRDEFEIGLAHLADVERVVAAPRLRAILA